MKANSECGWWDPRAAAAALGRWALGVIFLFFGIGKLPDVGYFAGYLAKEFQKTWLPPVLVSLFSHVLPFLEVTLGVMLLLGLFRNVALFAAGLLLISLAFGQVLLAQPQTVFANTAYAFMAAALLFLARYDRWVLFPPANSGHPT